VRSPLVTPAVVEAWFDTLRPQQQPVTQALRRALLDAAPVLMPVVKWGNLVFMLRGRHVLAIVAHREHARLQIFNGAALVDRHPALEGAGRDVRHVRFGYAGAIDEALVRALARDAVQAMGD